MRSTHNSTYRTVCACIYNILAAFWTPRRYWNFHKPQQSVLRQVQQTPPLNSSPHPRLKPNRAQTPYRIRVLSRTQPEDNWMESGSLHSGLLEWGKRFSCRKSGYYVRRRCHSIFMGPRGWAAEGLKDFDDLMVYTYSVVRYTTINNHLQLYLHFSLDK